MEGKGPSKSEDLQLVTGSAVAGDTRVSKEVAARCTGRRHHVQWEHGGCTSPVLLTVHLHSRCGRTNRSQGWTHHQPRGSGVLSGDTAVGVHWSWFKYGQCSGRYGYTKMSVFLRGGKYR